MWEQIVQSLNSWPVAAVLITMVLGLLFRGPIGRLIERTKSLGKKGLDTYDAQQTPATSPDALAQFLEGFENPAFLEMEAFIESDFQKRGITDPDDVRKALLKMLARAVIYEQFENIRHTIYGSQLTLLSILNEQTTPLEKIAIEVGFYDDAVARFPDLHRGSTFESWLGYLLAHTLIVEKDEGIHISPRGRELLIWRVTTGRSFRATG